MNIKRDIRDDLIILMMSFDQTKERVAGAIASYVHRYLTKFIFFLSHE